MSARRRIRDDYSSDDERAPPTRRSFNWFKEVQQHHRSSGKILPEPEARTSRASVQVIAPSSTPAAAAVAAAPSTAAPTTAAGSSTAPKRIFQGLLAAAPLPLGPGGSISLEPATNYVKALKEDGVSGLYVNSAVAGECYSLSVAERNSIVERFAREGLPVCVHVSCPSLSDTIAAAKHAQSLGVAAISVSVPFTDLYGGYAGLEDALDFINEVSRSAPGVPLLVEHDPARCTYRLHELLSSAVARGLMSNLRGAIAHSSDLSDLSAAISLKGSLTDFVYAADGNGAAASFLGATSVASREISYLGPLYAKLVAASSKGDIATTQSLQALLSTFHASIVRVVGSSPAKLSAASKCLTSLRSCADFGAMRPPGPRLTVHETGRLSDAFSDFIKVYSSTVKPSGGGAPTAVKSIKALDGYQGRLNGKIIERIAELERLIGVRNLRSYFPHLDKPDGSWRKAYPTEANCNPARHIDHTLLKPEGTAKEISTLCQEAVTNNFFAVCVNGSRVQQCLDELRGSGVRVAAVIGFPLGAGTPKAKAREARELVEMGAKEIDMVMNIGAMKDGNFRHVYEDVKAVVDAASPGIVKVIFETCLLSEREIMDASILCVAAGAQFVKTSTGFNKAGATPEALDIMLAVVGNESEVKAAGGVRDFATAAAYISAGVARIGTSSGVAIISGKPVGSGY